MPAILTQLRAQKGVTQEEAATHFGVSNKTVSKWETGASLPETEYLTSIADYYGVTIDELFGKEKAEKDIRKLLKQAFKGLNGADAIVNSFRLAHDIVLACTGPMAMGAGPEIDPKNLFDHSEYINRNLLACDYAFEALLNNSHANMVVMLTGNENNFAWLAEKADVLSPLLKFLSEPDVLKIIKMIHTRDFPKEFTASFMASAAGISEERATVLLNEAVRHELCDVEDVHLKDGLTQLFSSWGNGYILSAFTLIHEWVCGAHNYQNAFHGTVKLIKGGADV